MQRRTFLATLAATGAATAAPRAPIIDTHLEIWTSDPNYPFHHPERPQLKSVPVEAPVENEVAEMREFGIKWAVLSNPRYYGWDNSYISYALHRYPKLFVAHGLLDPEAPDRAGRLRYWIEQHGFQGMRFSPLYHPKSTWLNSKEHYPLWREAERLGAVFNYHILPHQMPMLEDMAGRFPGVKIVIDHLGKPDRRAADPWPEFRRVFRLKRFPQVWVSASEPYELSTSKEFPYLVPFFRAVYDEFGPRRLIWGTGYPKPRRELPRAREMAFVNQTLDFYSAPDRELILGGNALALWKFPK
jgi:predicted TIM-barrel fold metal-dependent hydrolase